MKTPKLLPWYARKAGVSTERAETLWHKAVREATAETGWVGNSEYWGACLDNFLALLEQERNTLCSPQVVPFVRSHNRLWRLPLLAMEDVFTTLHVNWQRHSGAPRKAA
jgi:maltooligosyltrehalose synthase